MGWQRDAEEAAREAGVDPVLYKALVYQESRGKQSARSGAGAIGYSQLMPDTARGLGVDPYNPQQNLAGGAKYLSQQLKAFGGDVDKALAAYNAGPGNVQKYGGVPPFAETQGYVKAVKGYLDMFGGASKSPAAKKTSSRDAQALVQAAAPAQGFADPGSTADATSALAALLSGQRPRAASASTLAPPSFAAKPVMGGAVPSSSGAPAARPDVGALIDAARTPGQAAAQVAQQASPLVADASSAPVSSPSHAMGGATAALGWAESKVGFKETGTNAGGLAGYLNKQFGFNNAPWCAMFTSAAVTKGGAPAVARTASVGEVRRQAEQGGLGYAKGFVDAAKAKAGDLILWGDDHIAMVQRVKNGRVYYVGGNQSDGVTEASVPVGQGDIVRPKYGARKR